MNLSTLLIIIIICGVIAGRLIRRFARAYAVMSGAEYLAVGVLLGPLFASAVTREQLDQLQPLVSLLIGVLGFRVGLMLRNRLGPAKTIPARLTGALLTMLIVAGGMWLVLHRLAPGMSWSDRLLTATTFGVIAGAPSITSICSMADLLQAKGWVTEQLEQFAMLQVLVAVVAFGFISAAMRSDLGAGQGLLQASTVVWVNEIALVGLGCGILFVAFIGKDTTPPRVFLATVGTVIFASGMAAGLEVSPLFVNLVVGATAGAFSSQTKTLESVLLRLEHPTFVLLLVLGGAMWQPAPSQLWACVGGYAFLRYGGLVAGTQAGVAMMDEHPRAPAMGRGLLAQGGYAVAIALNFTQLRPESASLILTTIFVAMMAQNLRSARTIRRALADAEELPAIREARADPGRLP